MKLLIFFLLFVNAEGFRILLLPTNMNSHVLLFGRIGEELSRLGHKTVIVAPSNSQIPHQMANENLTIIEFQVPEKVSFTNSPIMSKTLLDSALSKSMLSGILSMFSLMQNRTNALQGDFINLWKNKEIVKQLEDFQIQFALTDYGAGEWNYLLPYHLDIPYAIVSISVSALMYRVPRLPSFVSFSYSDQMNFYQRLTNFIIDIGIDVSNSLNRDRSEVKKYFPRLEADSLSDFIRNASLWFYTEDPVLSFARPHMPNTASIGDIMARPGNPLPHDLQSYLDTSTQGVILVSFGSYFSHIPQFIIDNFCEAFRNVSYNVIWKLANTNDICDADNIRIQPWLPQNDILAHGNCRLFITHGGFNSLVEAVYHGKPIIAFPIGIDQPSNAARAQARGYAVEMKLAKFSANDLRENIEKIINNDTFLSNARKVSKLFLDRRESAGERMAFMIEHVLEFGDAHLRTGAYKLSLCEFIMIDIFAFLFSICVLMLAIAALIMWRLCQKIKKCFKQSAVKASSH